MNTKKLSVFVIIITIFCVSTMVYNSKEKIIEGSKNKKNEANSIEENNKAEKLNSKENSVIKGAESKKINKPSIKGKENSSNSNNVKNNKDIDNNIEVSDKDKSESISKKKEIAVFKVSKGQIKDMLSLTDILRIESIAGKLSGGDFTRVKQYLQQGDDESAIKALKLLKERLSDKDYEKFKVVADKYINLEVVEGKWDGGRSKK